MTLRFSFPAAARARLVVPCLPLLLAACGGGGAGSASPPPDNLQPTVVLVEIVDDDDDPDDVLDTIEDVVEDTGATYLGEVDGTAFHRFELPTGLSPEGFLALVDDDIRITDGQEDIELSSPEGGGATIPLGGELFATAVAQQPELLRIGLLAAHDRVTGAGVRVAVLDTGIDPDHPLLVGHIAPGGQDFIDGDDDPRYVANGRDDDADGLIDEGRGHGTFVASLVLAVAPGAQIVPFRVLDSDSRGKASSLAEAIARAADLGVDVINLSAGMPTRVQVVKDAVQYARERGVLVVASAGNTGTRSVTFPASLGDGLSVTSVDDGDVLAGFASFGDDVDLSAPGQELIGAFPNGLGAVRWSGTSFSAALVSGAFALVREAFPGLDAEHVVSHLRDTSVDVRSLNPARDGDMGEGRLDLDAATAP
ncbi:MAG: S8 family serine peptidase [Planctomycetota bacterium]